MNESDIERVAARLGQRAAARLDVERTASAVVARLRAEKRVSVWRRSITLLQMAAAVSLLVGGGVAGYRLLQQPRAAGAMAPVVASLQTLSSTEMEEVLDSLATESPAYENVAVGLHDLSNEQLTELLHQMEG
jgi:hypothetical protein